MTSHTKAFPIGTTVHYTPGTGTYGYEHVPRDDAGRIIGTVVGHSVKRVRIRLQLEFGTRIASVYPESLRIVARDGQVQHP